METCKTTLEALVGAALSTDANTLGNNSGASYTNRFVFNNKYSFEAYCTNDKDILVQLCEVDGKTSKVLIGHCLNINHNELLAPIYAHFLWVDFESLLYKNDSLSHIDKEDFAINLLNCREDDMADRAMHTVERVFATATEYEKFDSGVHYFMSSEYGPVYFNADCFEYYINGIHALPEDILEQVKADLATRLEWLKDNKNLSHLSGLTMKDVQASALAKKADLLDKILDIVDLDCFSWALTAYKAIEDAKEARLNKISKLNGNSAEAFTECLDRFKNEAESIIDVNGTVGLAEELYNWQAMRGISFDFQTLALLFTELGAYEAEFSDELLRDTNICEVINIAYIGPSQYK